MPAPRLRTWLQLLRAPNLFTVPGDPLAGFILASGGALHGAAIFAVLASLCLYAGGLLLNDLFDLAEDRAERPNRPLPSGAASPRIVRLVAIALMLVGLAFALLTGPNGACAALALAGAIVTYNAWAKRIPIVGSLVMGLCRGLSLLIGALAAPGSPGPSAFVAAAIVALYIACVTNLARHETHASAPAWAKVLPPIPILAALIVFFGEGGAGWRYPAPATFAIALAVVVFEIARLFRQPAPPLPPVIGSLIRTLLILQAAFCMVHRPDALSFVVALALLAFWPMSYSVSRKFYAS